CDVVTVEVEGLGALTNRIVERDTEVRYDFGAQPSQAEEVVSTALGGDWEWRGIRKPMRAGGQEVRQCSRRRGSRPGGARSTASAGPAAWRRGPHTRPPRC